MTISNKVIALLEFLDNLKDANIKDGFVPWELTAKHQRQRFMRGAGYQLIGEGYFSECYLVENVIVKVSDDNFFVTLAAMVFCTEFFLEHFPKVFWVSKDCHVMACEYVKQDREFSIYSSRDYHGGELYMEERDRVCYRKANKMGLGLWDTHSENFWITTDGRSLIIDYGCIKIGWSPCLEKSNI